MEGLDLELTPISHALLPTLRIDAVEGTLKAHSYSEAPGIPLDWSTSDALAASIQGAFTSLHAGT